MHATAPASILSAFGYDPDRSRLAPLQEGYINHTFRLSAPGCPDRLLQQLSTSVFPDMDTLMGNLETVLPCLRAGDYREIKIIPARSGARLVWDAANRPWRMLSFIPDSVSYGRTDDPEVALESGRIIGRFHQLVAGLDPASLPPVLPDFHSLPYRLGQLREARAGASGDRLSRAEPYLGRAAALAEACLRIPLERHPVRVCHNDTKLSNILFHKDTGKALCLVDLDTLMPGYLLYDLGDALRILIQPLPEDHPDPEAQRLRPEFFEAFCLGLSASGLEMAPEEKAHVAHSALLMPSLHGIRALTDYLSGDRHYRVADPEQNLRRGANLLRTATLVERQLASLQDIANRII